MSVVSSGMTGCVVRRRALGKRPAEVRHTRLLALDRGNVLLIRGDELDEGDSAPFVGSGMISDDLRK